MNGPVYSRRYALVVSPNRKRTQPHNAQTTGAEMTKIDDDFKKLKDWGAKNEWGVLVPILIGMVFALILMYLYVSGQLVF